MSRIAKIPIIIPADVEVQLNGQFILVKGRNGELTRTIHEAVNVQYINNQLFFTPHKGYANGWVLAGTMRSLLNSMVIGVTNGFTKKLQLIGIGYRAIVNENIISLSIGFSHIINYHLPLGISAECHNQTEILLKSADKQIIGQVAADLRAYRPPEPYKGKGIRYADEIVHIKEAKKK